MTARKTFSLDDIQAVLARHKPRTEHLKSDLRPAAVLAPFYPTPDGPSLIFTKRTDHLDQHSGQISFPGGMRDPEDPDARTTALRETFEEIGVRPDDVEVFGRMNQEATTTGFSVAPFVGRIPYPYDFNLNAHEVERLIIVPLSHLLDPAFFDTEHYPWQGKRYLTYRYTFHDDVIWGATARIVHNFLTLLLTGREPDDELP